METKSHIQVFYEVLYNNRATGTFHWGYQRSICECLSESGERFHLKKVFCVAEEIANND